MTQQVRLALRISLPLAGVVPLLGPDDVEKLVGVEGLMCLVDLRLPPMERARLGTRANIFGSRHINRLFMRIQHEAIWGTWTRGPQGEAERIRIRVVVSGILDELQKAIRDDLGTDSIPVARAQQTRDRGTNATSLQGPLGPSGP
ncbi:hypothetical protein [Streptomyces asiaticus]